MGSVLQLLLAVATVAALTHRGAATAPRGAPAPHRTKRIAVFDLPDEDKQDALLAAAALQRPWAHHQDQQPPMHKATLTQIGYIQFLRYIVDVPELRELSFCVWLRSRNLTHNHPILSYSKNERDRLARAWVSPGSHRLPPRLHFAVLERTVLVEPLPEAAQRRWLHLCASWDGHGGHYRLHVNGRPRRAGARPEVAGLTLPAGGDVVVGQEYTDFDKGLDDGVEGDVFGFYLFRTAAAERADLLEHDEDLQRQVLRTRRRGDAPDAHQHQRRRSGVAEDSVRSKRQQHAAHPRWRLGGGPGRAPPVPARVRRLHACERLAPEDRADAVVAWPTTPVRVFGGAIIGHVQGGCGDF
ncbi:Pentraxin-4 [Frankliniella fusca]|uniref:Pentraxin-4 n=1 Tax=Frankliniella fusca TaxID=407009 RepID=A0AAE1L5W9_9NEOP|nr:Pentraxin-4 [Frankliniella fusca]